MSTAASNIEHFKRALKKQQTQEEDKVDLVDFKMVTFSLGGKDFGIDIMKVAEIARFVHFTYVPNSPTFVRGVYNLRGEIISIIDLRGMFNMPFEKKPSGQEEAGLILRLNSNLIGVVVDKIDKVVGINSARIQPPHPIFGDINIKYINGVVENEGRLYIILDVEKVLGKPEDTGSKSSQFSSATVQVQSQTPAQGSAPEQAQPEPEGANPAATEVAAPAAQVQVRAEAASVPAPDDDAELEKKFISEALLAMEHFHVSSLNKAWFDDRYREWRSSHPSGARQLQNSNDAQTFLSTFFSPGTGKLWTDDYADLFIRSLPAELGNQVQVWNPGCGKGFETYCIAAAIKKKFPKTAVRIWASDKDLLSVSAAPTLVFPATTVPSWLAQFMVEGKNGLSFNQTIRDSVLFEYHDVTNNRNMPPVQLVVARDLFSFLAPEVVSGIIEDLRSKMRGTLIVCLGQNEKPHPDFWLESIDDSPLHFAKVVK